MQLTPRLEEAIRIAAWAHREQTRKGSDIPYIIHPYSVMLVASQVTGDEDTLIACLFHDILEDVPDEYPEARMRKEFGDRVTDIVLGVSKDESVPGWRKRSEAYLDNLEHNAPKESLTVAAADKIHNLLSVLKDYEKVGDKLWERFTTNSAVDQLWWYESMLALLKRCGASEQLTTQLADLIRQLRKIVAAKPA